MQALMRLPRTAQLVSTVRLLPTPASHAQMASIPIVQDRLHVHSVRQVQSVKHQVDQIVQLENTVRLVRHSVSLVVPGRTRPQLVQDHVPLVTQVTSVPLHLESRPVP